MSTRRAWRLAVASSVVLSTLLLVVSPALSQLDEDRAAGPDPRAIRVTLELLAGGFERPVFATGTGDGSGDIYVVEQRGSIRRVSADGRVDRVPLLDISDRVLLQHERGLLGFALHPRFEDDPRLFVAYSRSGEGATVLAEFTLPALAPAPGPGSEAESDNEEEPLPIEDSERTLLVIPQPFSTHKAGMLAFDLDGMLLMGVGDGGHQDDPFDNGLDTSSLLGKLLRFDVESGWPYAIPPDNGFIDERLARPEIHAIGLRNPWRFSVDRETGRLIIADVGQREWEEINVYPAGKAGVSFGWSDLDGRDCFEDRACVPADHVEPAVAYAHEAGDVGHCAVIGGYTYRGQAVPLLRGLYLFSDFCSGVIWAVRADRLVEGRMEPTVVGALPERFGQPHSFGEDDAGELTLVTSTGDVLRIGAEPAAAAADDTEAA